MPIRLTLAFFVALLSSLATAAQPVSWARIAEQSHDLEVAIDGSVTEIRTTGRDPYFWFDLPPVPESDPPWVLDLEYFCADGIKDLQWRTGQPATANRFTTPPDLPPAEGWTRYTVELDVIAPRAIGKADPMPIRIDLGNRAGVRLSVRGLQVRPMNDRERERRANAAQLRAEKESLARSIKDYHERPWSARIEAVANDGNTLRFQGTVHTDAGKLRLVRRAIHSITSQPPTDAELATATDVTHDGATFQQSVPIERDLAHEIGKRWQLVNEDGDLASPAFHVAPNYQGGKPRDESTDVKKGLTCITPRLRPEQLRKLGLGHASINLVLPGLVSAVPGGRRVEQEIHGRKWYVNEERVRPIDEDVSTIVACGAQVAAILLIPNHERAPLRHPEADPAGTYAMPDLTTEEAASQYRATLEFLARRYGKDSPHGQIDHWIVHNEVDYGWQWTNMGEQPMEVFLEHYIRSMRLTDAVMRSHNPDARVFISLTHRWNVSDNQAWKTYAPRDMIDFLVEHCRTEGDFPWGIAQHPYPQSLWNSATWDDKKVSDDFETELITIKNIHVLDRLVRSPRLRMKDGGVRPVILSEQGFHADESDPEQLERQVAALLYTWQKLRQCPSILAFDYHRPTDHPNEGGLRLGLRGLPTAENRIGPEKPAWEAYGALGTDREAEYVRRYESFWKQP